MESSAQLFAVMGEPKILHEGDLKTKILDRMNSSVVTLLCDDTPDLKLIKANLNDLGIEHTAYHPLDHKYEVIEKFFDQVEKEGRGE